MDVRMLTYLCIFLVGNQLPSIKERASAKASAKRYSTGRGLWISLVVMTGHAAARTGGLAGGYEAIYIGCGSECSHVDSWPRPTPRVASLPSAYLASHDISETARLPYMECWSGAVLVACLPSKHGS